MQIYYCTLQILFYHTFYVYIYIYISLSRHCTNYIRIHGIGLYCTVPNGIIHLIFHDTS